MKEYYVSPEIRLVGFAPAENLAATLDEVLDEQGQGGVSGVIPEVGDLDIDIGR